MFSIKSQLNLQILAAPSWCLPANFFGYIEKNDLKKMDFQYFTRHDQKDSKHLLKFFLKL